MEILIITLISMFILVVFFSTYNKTTYDIQKELQESKDLKKENLLLKEKIEYWEKSAENWKSRYYSFVEQEKQKRKEIELNKKLQNLQQEIIQLKKKK